MSKKFKTQVFETPFARIKYALVCSEREHKWFTKKKKLDGAVFMSLNYGAQVESFSSETNSNFLLVHINKKESKGRDCLQIYSLLAHEAVHIYQDEVKQMRESQPSDEFMAYSIQIIAQNLFYAYKSAK